LGLNNHTDGQIVYLSPTVAGGITTTKPLAPYHIVKIGTVTRAHPTLGSIELKIENGWQLDELSDVQIALVPADSTILQFSRIDSLWHDVNPTTAMGNRFVKVSDSSAMLSKYLRKTDTTNKFVNSITRVPGKDSIIFYVGSTRYAIKDSSTGGTLIPGGNLTEVQIKGTLGFEGAYGFRYQSDYKRVEISDIEVGDPVARLDVHNGDQGDMPRNYEVANFSKNGESAIGVYNATTYASGVGASILLGNSLNTTSSNLYPAFQIRSLTDSSDFSNNNLQFNFQERNTSGTFVSSSIDIMNIRANGTVQLNPTGYSHSPTPRLVIGEDNTGDAALEVTGASYLNGKTTTTGARLKKIIAINDSDDGSTYSVATDDHIIIYTTFDGNVTVDLPASPENGRELIIKQLGDINSYTLTIDANGNEINSSSTANINGAINSSSVTIVYYNGIWYVINGEVQ